MKINKDTTLESDGDKWVVVDTDDADITITLPEPLMLPDGSFKQMGFVIKNTGKGKVIINPSGTETIELPPELRNKEYLDEIRARRKFFDSL